MKALKLQIFFFTIFFISSIQNELKPDAENVCLQSETYEETIIEKVKKPVREYKKKRCGKLFKKFKCEKMEISWKEVDEPRVVQKSRAVLKCCSGYKQIQENATGCMPVCSTGCVHGKCTSPDKCACMPGFHGPACSMRSGTTTAEANSPSAESYTQKIFQTTRKSELEDLTLMSEILKITNSDFITETAGEGTVSTAEATVTMTDETGYERSMTELEEKEISKEEFQNGKFTIAVDVELNFSRLLKASTEKTGLNTKFSNQKGAIGLENGVSDASKELGIKGSETESNTKSVLEELGIKGNKIESNTKPVVEFEEHKLEPSEIYGKNFEVYDFTSLLYVLPISCFILAIALWIIVKGQKKVRKSQTEKQDVFYSNNPLENLFWSKLFRNHSECTIGMSDLEPNSTQPILLGLSQRNSSESPINVWEAGPNNAEPLLKDLQECDRDHAIHSEGTFI